MTAEEYEQKKKRRGEMKQKKNHQNRVEFGSSKTGSGHVRFSLSHSSYILYTVRRTGQLFHLQHIVYTTTASPLDIWYTTNQMSDFLLCSPDFPRFRPFLPFWVMPRLYQSSKYCYSSRKNIRSLYYYLIIITIVLIWTGLVSQTFVILTVSRAVNVSYPASNVVFRYI